MGKDFQKLSLGATLGKKIVIGVQDAAFIPVKRSPSLNMFSVQTENNSAMQLTITLSPPQVIPSSNFPGGIVPVQGAIQDVSGERYSDDMLSSPSLSPGFSWYQAIAVVEWGVGGAQCKVEADFMNGLCLNLTASFVRIFALFDKVIDPANLTGGAYVFNAFVGPGSPKPNNAQKTVNIGRVAGGPDGFPDGSFPLAPIYAIPFFAKQVALCASRQGIPGLPQSIVNNIDIDIIFYRDIRGLDPLGGYRFTSDTSMPVKIPNGAYYFTVQNNSVPAVADCQAIFDLNV